MTNTTNKNSHGTSWAGTLSHPEQASPNHDANAKRGSVYDLITERVISLLERGTVPWKMPWQSQTGLPCNLITKRPYRGINVFLLRAMCYESPFWLTFRQAAELGGNVRKGEKACPVVFWKQRTIDDKETGEEKEIPLLRFYHLFNINQCEGLKNISKIEAVPVMLPTKPAAIVENMPQRPTIKHGMSRAFYSPSGDFVGMPEAARFGHEWDFFAALFHELIHSTGHLSRLNRPTLTGAAGFGSEPYCKEELIAEMGAAFLCGYAGIAERTIANSAAYLQSWLGQLRSDKKLIVQAAAQAQKAADFILGAQFPQLPTSAEGAGQSHA
jgi:antirestriction protein ArdC